MYTTVESFASTAANNLIVLIEALQLCPGNPDASFIAMYMPVSKWPN